MFQPRNPVDQSRPHLGYLGEEGVGDDVMESGEILGLQHGVKRRRILERGFPVLPDPRGTHYSLQDVASAVDVRYTPSIPTGVMRQFGLPGLPYTRVDHISSVVTAGSPLAAAANAVNRAERGEAPSRSFREPQDSCLQIFHEARVAEAEETLEKCDHVFLHVRRGERAVYHGTPGCDHGQSRRRGRGRARPRQGNSNGRELPIKSDRKALCSGTDRARCKKSWALTEPGASQKKLDSCSLDGLTAMQKEPGAGRAWRIIKTN